MKLEGSVDLPAAPGVVFERLMDPEFLRRCIPGCESIAEREPGTFEAVIKAGVGPVKGTFRGTVALSDVVPGQGYRMSIQGKAIVGHLRSDASVALEEIESGTRVRYEGDATVSGLIARVGGRLTDVAARKMIEQFFARVAEETA